MASYGLILNTKFKPFSYAEMLAPVAAATQAHQALEEEYGKLSAKANVWEEMANEQTDPYAYKMYKTYSDDLETRAEQLMRYGLNPASRKSMLDMRARYSKEIIPIETAYKRREALAQEQRQAMAKDPTLRYQRYARDMSLDDFIKSPSLDYGSSYSGELLRKQVSQIVANYQRELTDPGKLEKLGLPYQYKIKKQQGATSADIWATINRDASMGNPEAVAFLTRMRDSALQASGVYDWASKEDLVHFQNFANLGLADAIGKSDISTVKDDYSIAMAKAAYSGLGRSRRTRRGGDSNDNDRLPYRRISTISDTDKKSMSKGKSVLEFVNGMMGHYGELANANKAVTLSRKDSKKLLETPADATRTQVNIGARTNGQEIDTSLTSANAGRRRKSLDEYASKYGTSIDYSSEAAYEASIKKLQGAVQQDIQKSMSLSSVWYPNSTNLEYVTEPIVQAVQTLSTTAALRGERTGIVDKKGKAVSSKDLDKIVSSRAKIQFNFNRGGDIEAWLSYKEKENGENKYIKIPVDALDMGDGTLIGLYSKASSAQKSGDFIRAAEYMDDIQSYLDAAANSRAEVQSKSSSNLEFSFPWLED